MHASRPKAAQYPDLGSKLYLDDVSCVKMLSKTLYDAAHHSLVLAAPAIYAWALISRRIRDGAERVRIRREEAERQMLEDGSSSDTEAPAHRRQSESAETEIERRWSWFDGAELEDARSDPARYWAVAAVDTLSVYEIVPSLSLTMSAAYGGELDLPSALVAREALYDLLREGLELVGYDTPVLDALLAVLSPESPHKETERFSVLATRFLADTERFRLAILEQALRRYPYELSPLLRLLTALSTAEPASTGDEPDVVQILEGLQTVTLMVPENFRAYALENEDENANALVLTEDFAIFRPTGLAGSWYDQSRLAMTSEVSRIGQAGQRNCLKAPAGTKGMVIREDRPMVLTLEFPHSGLEYIGLLLYTLLPGSELELADLGSKRRGHRHRVGDSYASECYAQGGAEAARWRHGSQDGGRAAWLPSSRTRRTSSWSSARFSNKSCWRSGRNKRSRGV